jgi:CheY-like chemotaxis protein
MELPERKPSYPILLVEDEENDVILIERAFQKAGVKNPIHSVVDGQDAVDYLAGRGKFADRKQYPMPGLVLLDLNLPRKSGFEVLEWIGGAEMKPPILVICSSSGQPQDIEKAYRLGAHGYVRKPSNFEQLVEQARAIKAYWLEQNLGP